MQKCDGTADCPKLATEPDSWDERDCPQPIGCSAFLCKDKQTCLDESQVCDGVADCPMTEVGEGGEEEEDCDGSGLTDCQQGGSEDKTENRNYIIYVHTTENEPIDLVENKKTVKWNIVLVCLSLVVVMMGMMVVSSLQESLEPLDGGAGGVCHSHPGHQPVEYTCQ